jgi:hypothetical protein
LIVLRLFFFLALAGIALALILYLLRQDRRYLRLAWQISKFSLVLLLVFAALVMMGRIILFRMPL